MSEPGVKGTSAFFGAVVTLDFWSFLAAKRQKVQGGSKHFSFLADNQSIQCLCFKAADISNGRLGARL